MSKVLVMTTCLVGLLFYGFFKGVDIWQLLNFQSMIIVFGGLLLVLILGFPKDLIQEGYKNIIKSIREPHSRDYESMLLRQVLYLARIYRAYGPIALEKQLKKVKHDFLKYGASLVVEGYDGVSFVSALEREHDILDKRAHAQIRVIKTLAKLAPALGMAGTVISLMQVMQNLGSNVSLGASLGLALSSTLYGLVLANLFFLPISIKLQEFFERESTARIMLMDALIGLQQAEHPLRIAERLNSYDLYMKLKRQEKASSNVVPLVNKGVAASA